MTDQLQRPAADASAHQVGAPRRTRGARAVARHASDRGEGFGRFVGLTTLGALLPGVGLLATGRRKAGAAVLLVIAAFLAAGGYLLATGKAKSLGIKPNELIMYAAGLPVDQTEVKTEDAIQRDERLTPAQRSALLGVLRSYVEDNKA